DARPPLPQPPALVRPDGKTPQRDARFFLTAGFFLAAGFFFAAGFLRAAGFFLGTAFFFAFAFFFAPPRLVGGGSMGRPASSRTAASTSSACPGTETLSHRRLTTPSASIRYVVRITPMYFRPYIDFSP